MCVDVHLALWMLVLLWMLVVLWMLSCLLCVTSCVYVHLYRCGLISVHESDCVLKFISCVV